jgi:hypothetical protein
LVLVVRVTGEVGLTLFLEQEVPFIPPQHQAQSLAMAVVGVCHGFKLVVALVVRVVVFI